MIHLWLKYIKCNLDLHIVYSVCGSFMKKQRKNIKVKKNNNKKTGYSRYDIDITYGDFKHLIRKTASDKKLCDKAFNI